MNNEMIEAMLQQMLMVEEMQAMMFTQYETNATTGDLFSTMMLAECYGAGLGCSEDLDLAIELFLKVAPTFPIAYYRLALLYKSLYDLEEAKKSLALGAELGNEDCMEYLDRINTKVIAHINKGCKYYRGNSVEKDYAVALDNFIDASMANDKDGLYWLGYTLQELGEEELGFTFLLQSADLGEDTSQNCIGNAYRFGQGVEQNGDLAFQYYEMSAAQDNVIGIKNYGICFRDGIGTQVNKEKAFEQFLKGANLGDAVCQNNAGYAYDCGEGVEENPKLAFQYYEMSAAQDHAPALYAYSYCYQLGRGTEMNLEKAFEHCLKSANLGNHMAQNNVGYAYQVGEGVEQNDDLCFQYYEMSAMQGNQVGISNYAMCFRDGIGTQVDHNRAIELYQQSDYEQAIEALKLYAEGHFQ
ncbi:MAG: hypothetical protein R3Y54_04055 [Eubacteriales bacterium]